MPSSLKLVNHQTARAIRFYFSFQLADVQSYKICKLKIRLNINFNFLTYDTQYGKKFL